MLQKTIEEVSEMTDATQETYTDQVKLGFDWLIYTVGSYHYNWHPQLELFWLLKGQVEVNVDGARTVLHANDLMVINANCGHATFAQAGECLALRLHLDPTFYTQQGLDLSHGQFDLNSAREPQHPAYADLRQTLAQLVLAVREQQPAFRQNAACYHLADLLWTNFFNAHAPVRRVAKRRRGSLDAVMTTINRDYATDLSLEQLAQVGNYSPTYLSRLFKEELGINFYEYLVRCRLQHAVQALSDPTRKISDVALASGFKEIKSFNGMFKKHFGQTPSTYRQQLSATVRSQNAHFKQKLSPAQAATVRDCLTAAAHQTLRATSPCDACVYRIQAANYQALKAKVTQLKTLLNDEN